MRGLYYITDSSPPESGMVLGTPSHISPYQITGKASGGRSGLFAPGVVLCHLPAAIAVPERLDGTVDFQVRQRAVR